MLRDPQTWEYDILAIQEPWRNPFSDSTHHPCRNRFHLAYPTSQDPELGPARACFFVNARLNRAQWTFKQHSKDLVTPDLRYIENHVRKRLHIHKIYREAGIKIGWDNDSASLSEVHWSQGTRTQRKLIVIIVCLNNDVLLTPRYFSMSRTHRQSHYHNGRERWIALREGSKIQRMRKRKRRATHKERTQRGEAETRDITRPKTLRSGLFEGLKEEEDSHRRLGEGNPTPDEREVARTRAQEMLENAG